MNDFKKNNNFRGGDSRGGNSSRGNFSRPSFTGDRGYKGPSSRDGGHNKEMFQAICASCNKSCEVPFKPNGMKPVYCKDCFAANGGQVAEPRDSRPSYSQPARRDFKPIQSYKPEYRSDRSEKKPENNNGGAELKRTLELMNAKLDKLVQILSEKTLKEQEASAPKNEAKETTNTTKKVSKKSVEKKPITKKKK